MFVGTLTVIAVNGVATFSNLAINTAGTYNLDGHEPSSDPGHIDVHHDHRRRGKATGLGDRAPE